MVFALGKVMLNVTFVTALRCLGSVASAISITVPCGTEFGGPVPPPSWTDEVSPPNPWLLG